MTRWRVVGLVAALAVGAPVHAAEVVRLRVADTIQSVSQRFVERGLETAAERDAALVVIELDTPGGLVDNARELTKAITGSHAPVVVYVTPAGARAASAGFFLLISADVAAMAPGTNTGAAHPVLLPMLGGKEGEQNEILMDKATSDLTAMVRGIAEHRGRNVESAVKAVTESLSFTAEEALAQDLVDHVAGTLEQLLDTLDGTEVSRFDGSRHLLTLSPRTVTTLEPTTTEKLQSLLANPVVVLLLFAAAALGIYVEFTHPGAILPGVVGVVALLLFLYSTSVLPVNWLGVALIVVALVLFILEVKVTSYGLLTIGGIACFVAGALMLFDTPIPDMRLHLSVVLPTAAFVAAVMIFLLSRVLRAHQRRPTTGEEGLVGEVGRALSDLGAGAEGKVKVHGEWWNARARGGPIAAGSSVRVVAVSGSLLEVEAVGAQEGSVT